MPRRRRGLRPPAALAPQQLLAHEGVVERPALVRDQKRRLAPAELRLDKVDERGDSLGDRGQPRVPEHLTGDAREVGDALR